jgi:hypothetical protein
LNESALTKRLAEAPREFTQDAAKKNVTLSLPLPDGGLWQFRIEESPIMSSELATKFPDIKSYSGQGIEDPTASMRLAWSPLGLNAYVISDQGSFMVSPSDDQDPRYYLSFFTRSLRHTEFECLTSDPNSPLAELARPNVRTDSLLLANGVLREYRISFTVTQQFYQHFGGPVISPTFDAAVVAAINAYVSNLNLIYGREAAIRFKFQSWLADRPGLCGNPFSNCLPPTQSPTQMMQPNQFMLDTIFPGAANYDIGQALGYSNSPLPSGFSSFGSGGNNGIGGACENLFKGQSATLLNGSAGDYIGSIILAHELGHMFGARHTFSSSVGACGGALDPAGRVEPGSGSTIMSYAAACGVDNLLTGSGSAADDYFHVHSLLRLATHKSFYSACGQSTVTGNSPPVITSSGNAVSIPALTPFTLKATASDPNGDPITYNWEEFDSGSTLFRSFPGTQDGQRTFPSLNYILDNGNVPPTFFQGFLSGETLPSTTRRLNFRLTVRDNRSAGGSVTEDQTLPIDVIGIAGPFAVTQPNTAVTASGGTQTNVTWSVAGTNLAPINTSSVRILLSTDGGFNFPIVLAANTPNDGSELVTLPNLQTSTARVKVESLGNIYFDISDNNFIINQVIGNATVQFSAATYEFSEGAGSASLVINRSGNLSATSTVGYTSVDNPSSVACSDMTTMPGVAFARCDYATTLDTVTFGAGETQKVITVPLIDDGHVEGPEVVQFRLANPSGAVLGTQPTTVLTITDNDTQGTPNPIFTNSFLVREQYLDFLSREPEPSGFNAWMNVLINCPDVNNVDPASPSSNCDRINVSSSFFRSQEFQLKGLFVYRFYQVAFGRLPTYTEIVADMRAVTGATPSDVFQKKAVFTNSFAQRPEFTTAYSAVTNLAFVSALLNRYNLTSITTLDPANPDGTNKLTFTNNDLVSRLNANTLTRAQALRAIADSDQVFAAEVNKAFVAMQYYGYLRRTPEIGGYNSWLTYLNSHPSDFRTMVNGFVNSIEYRLRFGP